MGSQFQSLGFVMAIAVAAIGCSQPPSTRMQPQVGAQHEPRDAAAVKVAESSVRQTGYHGDDGLPAEPRISLTVQEVQLEDQPDVQTALERLWTDAGETRSRTMPTADIDAAMQSLTKHGLARHGVPTAMQLDSGQPGQWQDSAQWNVTATVGATEAIQVSLVASSLSPSADALPDGGWRTNVAAELHPGETLVVEGPVSQTQITEISRRPFLGALPIVGPLFFTNKWSTMETHKSLCLVTAKRQSPAATESDDPLMR